jgi:gamma-glutamyltranspeptidase/glutathione hydrolase
MEDLACHSSTWEEPISTSYRGFNIWECAPNGQGITALIALNILEGFDLTALEPLSPERLHLEIEAMRLAFADARQYISDPNFEHIPVTHLLSKEYAETRRQLINRKSSKQNIQFGYPLASSDTVYLSVVDGEGNACSFINSIYMEFGSGIVPAGTGFCLQNRGANFSLDPSHPNHLEPQKRPYHTIIPAMATSANGNLYASFGVMGGFMQPQGHVQVAIALFDDQLDPQSTLDRPRFCINAEDAPNQVLIEEGIPEKTISALAQMGHETFRIQGMDRSVFGRGQVIIRDASTGVLTAGSDPRADGCAMPLG